MPALHGLRVLDFSRVLAGPFATMMLGDLGATVLKVERPGIGDETRAWGPPFDADGAATYFEAVNRNKRSIVLDLQSEEGRELAVRLATEADVLIENFRPGVIHRLGLGFPACRERNPGLIYCSITGFGAGAGAGLPGYDLLIQAMGGLMSITGAADGDPQKVGVALVDVLAGLFATTGILAALHERERSGEGQHVEVSLFSALLGSLVNQGSGFTIAGVVPGRMGNDHPSIAPYGLFRAADRELVLAVGNDRQFETLCNVLGAAELAVDERFVTNADRVANRADLVRELEARLLASPAAAWASALIELGVPAGVVNDVAGAFALAESIGLDPIVAVPRVADAAAEAPAERAGGGTRDPVRLTRNPIGLSRTPAEYRYAPPRMPTRDGARERLDTAELWAPARENP
jgi:crotonobetainyl-CoA:carnitine CoA-transferase CaiB-like acyl-CoA transferase